MLNKKLVSFLPAVLISTALVKLSTLVKFSFIVGSSMAFFSGSSIAMPLVGAFSSWGISAVVFGMLSLIQGSVGMGLLHYLAYHIPGLCAAAYWAAPSLLIRFVLPLACMIAFIAHPQGGPAWLYAMYWLIPAGIYLTGCNGLFATALGSTFVAHAVGSVIWIYTVPMTSATWLALIPVVAVERLLFAAGMVVVYQVVVVIKNGIPRYPAVASHRSTTRGVGSYGGQAILPIILSELRSNLYRRIGMSGREEYSPSALYVLNNRDLEKELKDK